MHVDLGLPEIVLKNEYDIYENHASCYLKWKVSVLNPEGLPYCYDGFKECFLSSYQ
jgi:hypothetical protein